MSTASEGTAATYEGGGAGGKFRKRPLRRNQATPYDRPPTALRNPSWLTKVVVDPASKLITYGAQRFFSSIFRKRLEPSPTPLPLPPPPPGPSKESQNLPQESRPNEYAGAPVVAGQGGDNDACSSGDGTFSELEQLLKQKTFRRTEIDRLTELLLSKAVDMPMGYEEKRAEAIQSRRALDSSSSLLEENRSVKVTAGRVGATPVMNSRILEDDIASPAELAKAYMGSRPSKVSPSMLSTRSQVVREDTPLLTNVQYVQRSPIPSVTTRIPGFLGVRENGFTTPRSRGRSAIYSMAHTPYSRVRQTDVQKATSSANYVCGGASSSKPVSEHDVLFGSKQALKRRSYVLDDDLGSVGPMRRIRQKPNLSFGASRPSAIVASAANMHPEVSKVGDVEDNKTTPTRHVAIPTKSSETAAKILEQLEKITPKGKSLESKLAAGKVNKLTPNMLHGRALRSLEDLDSPKLLQSVQDSYKLENWSKILSPNPSELKQSEIKQNGYKSSVSESTVIAKKDAIFSFKDTQPIVETNSLEKIKSASQPPHKKRAFKMSAYEDSFELEEDINSNGPSSQLAEGRGKLEIPAAADQKPLYATEPSNKPVALLEVKTPPGLLGRESDMETPDTGVVAVTASNKSKETNVDMVPPFLFSSSTPVTGSKPGSSSSLSNLASSPADARPNPFQFDNSQKAVDSNGNLEALSSGPSSSISTSGIFSFGAPSSPSSNGLFAPSPAISATSALTSGSFTNDVSTRSLNVVAPLTSITSATTGSSTASASSIFGSGAASSVSKEPLIKFGFSGVPPKTVSAPAKISTAETTDVKAKSETGTTFGNLKSSPFGGASFAATGSGNSIFGFSSSVMSTGTTGSTQSQGSVFSTGGESLVSAETSVGGSGISAVSGSLPSPFSSSASLPSIANFPVFGSAPGTTGQVSASPSINVLVGSSNAASGIFSFGASSSASSAAGSSSGLTNGTLPLAFTFSASSAATPSKTSVPATSSSATPGVFSFSGSSSASSTNAVNISSSTTPSIFNFGGNTSSSSAKTVNTSATPGIFNIGGSSTSPANAAGNTSTSASPSIFSFGASSSASLTNAGSTVNPSPFNFGATLASSQASSAAGTFGSSWQLPDSTGFSSSFSSSNPSGFTFGASSSSLATPTTSPVIFDSSGSAFLFGSTSSTNSLAQPFGNSAFAASPGNNDNMEDSMAEDLVQAPAPAVSFGQPSVSPSPGGFSFGSAPSPFQFGGQQSQAAPQNSSPFAASSSLVQPAPQSSNPFAASSSLVQPAPQSSNPFAASISLEFGGGGSFSLGSSGPDKSGRKIVKVNRSKHRKK